MIHEVLQQFRISYSFPVTFTRGVFALDNPVLANVLARAEASAGGLHRVLVIVDSGVADANPGLVAQVARYVDHNRSTMALCGDPVVFPGGESCKNTSRYVDQVHVLVKDRGVCRHSFVLAIGGGALLDAVGYGAATAHRGVRLVRMPTTVLAQNDAGIGVKNGINAFGRKNFLGTFAPPFAVINDLDLLATLDARDKRSGLAEAIKVAAIKDRAFLEWMHEHRGALASFDIPSLEHAVIRCAELHLEHVRSGDPFELGSARPLDFGHWSAHALEEVSHGALRHGEAVAIGVALDSLYACRCQLLCSEELRVLLQTLQGVGFDLFHEALLRFDIGQALDRFREHLGGLLCVTLPDGLGRKVEVHEVDVAMMRDCIKQLQHDADALKPR